MFGGVISLTSDKGDVAAIDLPEGSYFFDYRAFHESSHMGRWSGPAPPGNGGSTPGLPGTDSDQGEGRIPDTRNTLLWIDRLKLEKNKQTVLQFPAASSPGEYLILVRGLSPEGIVVSGEGRFSVK